jgi:hypothetical protein
LPVKVLLVVIDAATSRVVCPAVQTGRLANLKRLADSGGMHPASISVFPTTAPAATTSIVTGTYPTEHGIAGASWYDPSKNEVTACGEDFWSIAKQGLGVFFRDWLLRLNGERLKAPTIFELIERTGRKAAAINYFVYRGKSAHKVNVSKLAAFLPGVPLPDSISGPSTLFLGEFVTTRTLQGKKVEDRGGPLYRFGMDDASTTEMLSELVSQGALGDFTVAYFGDNDSRSHEVGPYGALPVVDRVDQSLGRIFDAAGGFEKFTRDICVIVTATHGHCEVLAEADRSMIRLDRVLGDFQRAEVGRPWRDTDEILICPNLRAAQIYVRKPSGATVDRIVRAALADRRVDLALWHTRLTSSGIDAYAVASQRGRLEFWRRQDRLSHAKDAFGTEWSWRGDRTTLQLEVDGRLVESADYPNAFERIAGVLDSPGSGEVWLTAQPGCEFEVRGGQQHAGGGSHGGLHVLDSYSPVIVGGAGAPKLPRVMRTVDITPLCMELLGVQMRYRVGDPRGAPEHASAKR